MTAHRRGKLYQEYQSLNAISTVMGLFVAVGAAHVYEIIEFSLLVYDYTLTGQHAAYLTLLALLIAALASDTRDWRSYEPWEKVVAGGGIILIGVVHFTTWVDQWVYMNSYTMIGAFVLSIATWLVVAR